MLRSRHFPSYCMEDVKSLLKVTNEYHENSTPTKYNDFTFSQYISFYVAWQIV